MKRTLMLTAFLSLSPGMVLAQSSFDSDLDMELAAVSANRTGPQAARGTPTAATIAPQGSVGNGSQPIYILNQATPTSTAQVQQTQVQKQPQVDIYGAPVQPSRADLIREARQKAEIETENRIAEKLEQSRIEDEKRRAALLFGNTVNQTNNVNAENVNVSATQIQTGPVVVAQPETKPEGGKGPEKPSEPSRDGLREEIREEIRASMIVDKLEDKFGERRYFGALAGINEIPDAANVRGNYAFAASFGTVYDSVYAVEGTFGFSNYTVADLVGGGSCYTSCIPREIDTNQYSGSVAMKYIFLDGMIKPMVGGLMQYSYRTFAWSDSFGAYDASGDASSHAIDLGLVLGTDIVFSKKFSLGFDFRYMWNMASRVNAGSNASWFVDQQYIGTKPIEKFQYYTMGIVGRLYF